MIKITFENRNWYIRNLILNNLDYLRGIHVLHEKTFNPSGSTEFNDDNYFETQSVIGNKKIKVYVVDASKDKSVVSATIKKIHKQAQFITLKPTILRSSTLA